MKKMRLVMALLVCCFGQVVHANNIVYQTSENETQFIKHLVDNDFNGRSVFATDLDYDGDIDIVAAEDNSFCWFKNNGNDNYTKYIISGSSYGNQVYKCDINNDNNVDILGAAHREIKWWENDGKGILTEHLVYSSYDGQMTCVYPSDINKDGHMDIIAGARGADNVAWLENDGNGNFTKHIVGTSFDTVAVRGADMDSDGDMDIVGVAYSGPYEGCRWWENNGSELFTEHIICNSENAWSDSHLYTLSVTDFDGNEFLDIIAGGYAISIWTTSDGLNFSQKTVQDNSDSLGVDSADLDGDGLLDIIGASATEYWPQHGELSWWKNCGRNDLEKNIIDDSFERECTFLYPTDMDYDGDIDLVAVSRDGVVAWYENIMTQHSDGDNTPIVTVLSSQYCSYSGHAYFISGVSLNQEFTAVIDWNGKTASQVKWYRDSTVIATDSISGNSISRTVNVGTDFNVGKKLYVQAIASDGTTSAKVAANFDVISPPPGLAGILSFQNGKYKSSAFGMSLPSFDYDLIEADENNELKKLAQIGLSGAIDVYADVDLYGYARIKAVNLDAKADGFKLSGLSLGADLDIALNYNYFNNQWHTGGQLGFGLKGKYETPSYYILIFGVPAVYINCTLDAEFYSDCKFISGNANIPLFSADIPIEAGVEAELGVGVNDAINVEVYGTGRVHFDLQLPDEPILRDWYVEIGGGARWQVFFWNGDIGSFSYRWPEEGNLLMNRMMIPSEKNFQPMPRDYITNDYAQWHGGISVMKTKGIQQLGAGSGTETIIQSNIFGQSDAVMAASGGTKCLVWLFDEPTRNSLDRTMLVYSINEGNGWSTPVAIDDDGTADVTPSLTVDANGKFVCVWANASQLIPDGTNLAGFADKLDIEMAVYDSVAGAWANETVTNTSALDYNPKVACNDSNDITVIWTHDDNNDMLASNPPVSNTIMARTKTGTGWLAEQSLAPVSGLVKYTDIEADSAGAHIVYCLDTDSDFNTDTDNELYYINDIGGSWTAPARLTNDIVPDVNPQLIKTTSDLMLLWAKDGKIVSTTDIAGMTGITDVVPTEGSSGQRGFVAAVSPTDNISVIWNDPSEAGTDIYTATYDPTMSAWSDTVQVTNNRDMERSITTAYSAGDTLELAYNKVHIIDEQEGLDAFGQVDLCTYQYQIGSDLAVVAEGISITDPNAVPGDTVTLQAIIANDGDTAVSNIPVAFYCGDTPIAENQIDATQTITGPLAAGTETTASVSWTIPESDVALNVIIVIDPYLQIEDKNRQDNSASIDMFGADVTVDNIVINKIAGDFYITADIVNSGFTPLPENIAFILAGADDPNVLDSKLIAALEPGQTQTVTLIASSEDMGYGFNSLKLTIDPDNIVAEISENNNTSIVNLMNYAPYDIIADSKVDMADLSALSSRWLSTGGFPSADIFPHPNGDGIVNLLDFALLAEHWFQIPEGEVSVDGDISEWSDDVLWQQLDETYWGDSSDILDAEFALSWNEAENKVYVAVKVTDTDRVFSDTYVNWQASDRLEIYSQGSAAGGTGWIGTYDIAQQYYIAPDTSGGSWATWAWGEPLATDVGMEYAVQVSGDVIIYEIGVTLFENYGFFTGGPTVVKDLSISDVIGFDVVTLTQHAGGVGMKSENLMTGKSNNADKFRKYILVE